MVWGSGSEFILLSFYVSIQLFQNSFFKLLFCISLVTYEVAQFSKMLIGHLHIFLWKLSVQILPLFKNCVVSRLSDFWRLHFIMLERMNTCSPTVGFCSVFVLQLLSGVRLGFCFVAVCCFFIWLFPHGAHLKKRIMLFHTFFIYSGCKSFIRYMYHKCFFFILFLSFWFS